MTPQTRTRAAVPRRSLRRPALPLPTSVRLRRAGLGPAAVGDEACFLHARSDASRHPRSRSQWTQAASFLRASTCPGIALIRLLAILVLLGTSIPARLHAADQPLVPLDVADEGAPTFSVYSSREGLSDEIWSTLGFDRNGFVWAGSASSLARFDGYTWTPWPFAEARSLVRDMQIDSSGVLWAIFEREGLARYDGIAWSLYPYRNTFHQRFSDTTRVDGTKDYWLGLDRGYLHLQGGSWLPDPGNAPIEQGPAGSIEQTDSLFGEPRQWMAINGGGLWYRRVVAPGQPEAWRRFEAPEFNALRTTAMLRTHDAGAEELWVLTYGDGLLRIRNDGIRIWRAARGELPAEALYSAQVTYAKDGERSLWIASRAGLLRMSHDRLSVFDRRHGLPSDAVRGIKVQRGMDGIDILWLATEGGIARAVLADSPWQTVSLMGARENGIFTVMIEPDGHGSERLWVGTPKRGLGLLERGEWKTFSQANGKLPAEGVRQLWRLAGPDGKPQRILSLVGGDLFRIDDDLNLVPIATPWPKRDEEVASHALARTQDGHLEWWISSLYSGIHRWRDGKWTSFLPAGQSRPWSVVGLTEQIDGNGRSWLWAASATGLARFDGQNWDMLPDALGLSPDGFRGVSVIREGERSILWASSNRSGVVRLDVTDPQRPSLAVAGQVPAAPDPTVYSVLADSQGRIYVCTNNGVQQLTPGANGDYAERVFRRRDGLVHDECNTNAQLIDAHDRYWVGTLGGLSLYDPRLETPPRKTEPKPLWFTGMTADGDAFNVDGEDPVELPAGARDLRIDYTIISGLREQESTYRSQLHGFDTQFSAWTSEHGRRFSGLAPGIYELRVEARDYAGTPSAPRSLKFSIAAHWWQEDLVRAVGALLLVTLIAGFVLLYNRGLRTRQRNLRGEVARRTAQLQAANRRLTELSYQDPLTGVANRRRLMEVIDDAIARAINRSLPIGLIVIDVDNFKEYNDQHGHLAGDAALRAVAQALQSVTREQDLVARFGGEEFACLMIDATIDSVAGCAERMRVLIEALPPRMLGNNTQTITISAGAMSRVPKPGDHAADLLRDADGALYRAKNEGRNRVCRVAARPQLSPAD